VKTPRPSKAAIVAEQECLTDWLDVGPDPMHTCWACRGADLPLERAHLIPAFKGGSSHPSNFVLMCGRCHYEHCDTEPLELQLLWLKHHETTLERHQRLARPWMRAVELGEIAHERVLELLDKARS
jgi:5-methylcytosine-specific restriction endonuclease McrA